MSIKKYKNDLLDIVDRTPIPGKNIINNYVSLYYNSCDNKTAKKDFGCQQLQNKISKEYDYSFENELI